MGTVLEAIPDGIFSVNFSVLENGRKIGAIQRKLVSLSLRGSITVNGVSYVIYRNGWFSGTFFLESKTGNKLAVARRQGLLSSNYRIEFSGHSFFLKKKLFSLHEKYYVISGDARVGTIMLQNIFARRMLLETEIEIQLEIRVFILWLAIVFISASQSSDTSHS